MARSPKVRTDLPIPKVAYLDRKVRLVPDLNEVWSYINPFMLYRRHMGFEGILRSGLRRGIRKQSSYSKIWRK